MSLFLFFSSWLIYKSYKKLWRPIGSCAIKGEYYIYIKNKKKSGKDQKWEESLNSDSLTNFCIVSHIRNLKIFIWHRKRRKLFLSSLRGMLHGVVHKVLNRRRSLQKIFVIMYFNLVASGLFIPFSLISTYSVSSRGSCIVIKFWRSHARSARSVQYLRHAWFRSTP